MHQQPQQQPPQQQQRRNTPRKGGRPTQTPRNVRAAKNYASENDIPRDSSGIKTPRNNRANNNYAALRGNPPATGRSAHQQRPRNKGRPTSLATSTSASASPAPRGPKTDGDSPPLTAKAAPAYAGATFHASPAPSTLPIPSFMKLAGPDSPRRSNPAPTQEPSPPASDSEAPTPPAQTPLAPTPPAAVSMAKEQTQANPEASPLDMLFRAQRAENAERTRRASSAHITAMSSSPFSAVTASPFGPFTTAARSVPRQGPPRGSFTGVGGGASGGISSAELDGTPGRPIGPTFSTPFQDRIRAARSNGGAAPLPIPAPAPGPALAHEQPSPGLQPSHRSPEDRAQALKDVLGIQTPGAPQQALALAPGPALVPAPALAPAQQQPSQQQPPQQHMQHMRGPMPSGPMPSAPMPFASQYGPASHHSYGHNGHNNYDPNPNYGQNNYNQNSGSWGFTPRAPGPPPSHASPPTNQASSVPDTATMTNNLKNLLRIK